MPDDGNVVCSDETDLYVPASAQQRLHVLSQLLQVPDVAQNK